MARPVLRDFCSRDESAFTAACDPVQRAWGFPGRLLHSAAAQDLTLPLLTGCLIVLASLRAEWALLAWIALVPFGYLMTRPKLTLRMLFGAYLGGFATHLVLMDWMRTSDGGVGLEGDHALPWLVTGQTAAFLWPAMLWLGIAMRRAGMSVFVALPAAWVAGEWTLIFASSLPDQAGCPWIQLGLTQAGQTLTRQVADLGGVFLISGILASFAGCIVGLLRELSHGGRGSLIARNNWRLILLALALPGLVSLYGYFRSLTPPGDDGPVVALMPDGDIAFPTDSERIVAEVSGLRNGLDRPEAGIDLLVWTELAYRLKPVTIRDPSLEEGAADLPAKIREIVEMAETRETQIVAELLATSQRTGAAILMGCKRLLLSTQSIIAKNSVLFVDGASRATGVYDKVFLVPGTEIAPAIAFPTTNDVSESLYVRGDNYPLFPLRVGASGRLCHFASPICYDSAFPQLFRRFMMGAAGVPDFFVAAGNEGSDSSGRLQTLMLAMCRFRAVESRRSIVRCVWGGYSAVIDSNGEVRWRTAEPRLETPTLAGPIPLDGRRSLYSRFGDWPVAVVGFVCLWGIARGVLGWYRTRAPGEST